MVLIYDLRRHNWSKLNRFRSGHGRCKYLLSKRIILDLPVFDCEMADHTMFHIVEECPIRKFSGGFVRLHYLKIGAIDWLQSLDVDV